MGASLLLSLTAMMGGCGHSNDSEHVSATITAEEMQAGAVAFDGSLDADVSEVTSSEEVVIDSPAPAQADSSEVQIVQQTEPVSPTAAIIPPQVRMSPGMNYAVVFNDSNHFQLAHAKRLGINPIKDMRGYFHNRRPLVKIATNDDYVLENLTHSYPYLVPEADRLLQDIGKNFRDSLKSHGIKEHRVIVTSVLRTPDTVKKLMQVNVNAAEMSTHQYGTTFDLSYNKFAMPAGSNAPDYVDLRPILAEVLDDLRKDGRCLVKYEIKSPCFHITVAR